MDPKMQPTYLVNADADHDHAASIETRIRGALPEAIRLRRIEDAAGQIARKAGPIFVLVLAPVESTKYIDQLVDLATRHRDRIFFILISNEISATDCKRLVRTGSADWVDAGGPPQEILDIVAGRPQALPDAGAAPPSAVLFLPSAGGVGNTTLAVEVAVQLRQGKEGKDRRVCLVDLDFQTSHICDHLDIEPRLQIAEIASNPGRLDDQLFEIFISRHASGVHVLAAPRSKFEFASLDIAALDTVFDMIADRYDVILIDAPAAWHPWTPRVVAAADNILVTGLNTIPGLRQVSAALAATRHTAAASAQTAVVLNRCERGMFGGIARRSHVDSILGDETVVFVRNDPVATQCVNTGMPITLAAPRRKVVKDIAAIAALCANPKAVEMNTTKVRVR
jgi:pilus assembly protein CpaE